MTPTCSSTSSTGSYDGASRARASPARRLLPRSRRRARVTPRRQDGPGAGGHDRRRAARRRSTRSRASARARFLNVHAPSCGFSSTCAASTPARTVDAVRRTTPTASIDCRRAPVVGSRDGRGLRLPSLSDTRAQGGRMARNDGSSRRTFLKKTGAAGVAVAGGTLWATAPAAARARRYGKAQSPLRHLVVSCQENRSFDHYFGYAPQVQAKRLGPPRRVHAAGRGGRRPCAVRAHRAALARPAALVGRRAPPVERRPDGRLLPEHAGVLRRRQHLDAVLHGEGAAVLLQPVRQARGSARTTSARCSGRRGRTAST